MQQLPCRSKKQITLRSFSYLDWVKLRWEDNHPSAKIELLKSLGNGFEGVHHVEWIGSSKDQADFDSNKLIWSAWDYLKNRSQIVGKMKNLTVEKFFLQLFMIRKTLGQSVNTL